MDQPTDPIAEHLDHLDFGHLLDDAELDEIRLKETRALVMLAVGHGWSHTRTHGVTIFHAADGTDTSFRLSLNQSLNFKVFRSHVRTIARHRTYLGSHPFYRTIANSPIDMIVDGLVQMTKMGPTHARLIRQVFEEEARKAAAALEAAASPVLTPPEEPEPVLERRVTKEEPWTAHGRNRGDGSETYPSDAVLERTWTDDTVEYICRWPDCGWTSSLPRSVAAHYGTHIRGQGRQERPEPDGIDLEWTPSQTSRIRRLKRELDGALVAGVAAAHDINDTEWIAAWIITHRIEGLSVSRESASEDEGPWTAEQILDKIAALADRGRAHVLREQIEMLNVQLDQAEAARVRAEGNLHALRDMLNETD